MKVLFDHQIFGYLYGGAAKYFAMLLDSLPHDNWDVTSLISFNEYVREKKLLRTWKKRFRGENVLMDYINSYYTCLRLRYSDYDIYHQTNFMTSALKYIGKKPMVTTYHDSNFSTFDYHPELVKRQALSLERADAIIVVSENTKKDLLNLFDIAEEKVNVIYHGIEIPDLQKLKQYRLIDYPYFLYVGRRTAYKNFRRLLQAFALFHQSYKEVKLVCTSQEFSSEEIKLFKELQLENSLISIKANEQEMQLLYRDAIAFVFPSFYEGFGMPILEAWSCRCPVVLSKASCFPEIADDAGLYFDAKSIDDMVEKLKLIWEDSELRNMFVMRGENRVKQFSWKKCADMHLDVYHSLL